MFDWLKYKPGRDWRRRALIAEAEVAALRASLDTAAEHLNGIELRFASRATLVSIKREGRANIFLFVRNGELFQIETMGTWDDDMEQWKRDLLEPIKGI